MPRETIHTDSETCARVGWSPQGGVQLGVDAVETVVGVTGLWTDLDRRGCNDLIRVLRRARDSAFGRDE